MTTELRQSIELLQYSTYDLEQFIRQQELENPLIDLQESKSFEDYSFKQFPRNTAELSIDHLKSLEEDFREKLIKIVNISFKENEVKKLLTFIVYNLNNNGYLEIDETSSYYPPEDIKKGIRLLQQVGPAGIGARNLEECLLIQCDESYPDTPALKELIQYHLPLLAQKKYPLIAQKLNCSVATVKELNRLLLTLNPKPCSFMQIDTTEYLQPDIIVELQHDELSFHLNDFYLPHVTLNKQYLTKNLSREDQQYIYHHYKNYEWLISSIKQRRNTINTIMNFLIKKQSQFFRKGPFELVPLTLKEVAVEIRMHESTISRATSNKYIQTPFGTFDLKSLFTQKIETKDGNLLSQEKVKIMLKQLIEQENKRKPYSDQKIAEYFNTEYAIQIARRTINKYRAELNIPSASMRKQWC